MNFTPLNVTMMFGLAPVLDLVSGEIVSIFKVLSSEPNVLHIADVANLEAQMFDLK